jgi:translation elongation factor EF-Tu-like GTPase
MLNWLQRAFDDKPLTLAADAQLVLTAEAVFWHRALIVVGQVECEELKVGDEVIAVGDAPLCRGRVDGLEQFQRSLDSARRGDHVGVIFTEWSHNSLPKDLRLYRVRTEPQ